MLLAEGVFFSMSTKSSGSSHRKTATSWNSCDMPYNVIDKTDTLHEKAGPEYTAGILTENYIYSRHR
jgi:hypothetical protein